MQRQSKVKELNAFTTETPDIAGKQIEQLKHGITQEQYFYLCSDLVT